MTDKAVDPVEHLRTMLREFTTAMLVTRRDDGGLRSRPMAIAEARIDGVVYFSTAIDSPKIEELAADSRVNVAMQSGGRFVSITGRARVVKDRALLERLWSEAWRVWFPGGKDDPTLCLIAVEPEEAEYWDRSGAKGIKSFFQMAKAYVSGTQPGDFEPEQHSKIRV
jgi:general stress protein 26